MHWRALMDYLASLHSHFKPRKGWVNDPNGLVFYKGYYHLFYQHAPDHEIPWKQPMHWGHARTKDFLHWEELPVALYPDTPYDNQGVWSGTAIVKDDTLYLFYASIYTTEDGEKLQTVSVASSTDGITFCKFEKNPVIGHYPPEGGPDFRDPAVACIDGEYYCVMASGHPEDKTGLLLLYKSNDLLNWNYEGIMRSWDNARYTECPSFMPAGDKCIVCASVCHFDSHYFSVMYGTFRNGTFTPEITGNVDMGPDQYAGQAFCAPDGRHLLIAWIPGWRYAGYAEKNVGCFSVPRELVAENGKLYGRPAKEVRHLLKESDPCVIRTEDGFIIPRTGREPVVHKGEVKKLEILRDEYIVEVFVNDGEVVYSALL